MEFSELDLLLMMNCDDIDYSSLSEDMLKTLALENELYIATLALGELEKRESKAVDSIAWKILAESHGDSYLQAAALESLFKVNPEQAFQYMTKQVVSCDPYILNSMMELMLEEQPYFKAKNISSLVKIILARLKKYADKLDFGIKTEFKRTYGQKLSNSYLGILEKSYHNISYSGGSIFKNLFDYIPQEHKLSNFSPRKTTFATNYTN